MSENGAVAITAKILCEEPRRPYCRVCQGATRWRIVDAVIVDANGGPRGKLILHYRCMECGVMGLRRTYWLTKPHNDPEVLARE